MTLRLPSIKTVPVRGSGPGGKIQIDDIRSKLSEIQGEAETTAEKARPTLLYVAIGGVIATIVLAFLVGRGQGRRKSTWVEVRRL